MQRAKVVCELCGQEISNFNYGKHLRRHKNNPESFKRSNGKYALNHDGLTCQFCGKECKNRNSLCNHERLCKENPNRQVIDHTYKDGRTSWNKGLTKNTDDRVKNSAKKLSLRYKNGELIPTNLGKHLTEEQKKKLSVKRKEFLCMNPDKVPYLLNHSSKMSYPEEYFIDVFSKENIDLIYHHRVNIYELDFCDLDKKIDIEIDGEQHYLDEKIVKSDINREKFLTDSGWSIYRIRWSDYKKLSIDERKKVVEEIKRLLR